MLKLQCILKPNEATDQDIPVGYEVVLDVTLGASAVSLIFFASARLVFVINHSDFHNYHIEPLMMIRFQVQFGELQACDPMLPELKCLTAHHDRLTCLYRKSQHITSS